MYSIKAKARLFASEVSELSDSSLHRIAQDSSDFRQHAAEKELERRGSKSSFKDKTEIFKNVGLGLGGLAGAGAYGYIGHQTGKAADNIADAADNARRMISDENERHQLMHNKIIEPDHFSGLQRNISTDNLDYPDKSDSIINDISDSAGDAWNSLSHSAGDAWDAIKTTVSDNSDLLTDLF